MRGFLWGDFHHFPHGNGVKGYEEDYGSLEFPLGLCCRGNPNAVFALSPRDLVRITKAEVVNIKEG